MAATDWEIKTRASQCTATSRPFAHEETFYTLLYRTKEGFRREDLCEEAWAARNDNLQPFSFWKSKFVAPTEAPPDPLPSQSIEGLLRDFMSEDNPEHAKARYILAVMLERKRALRHIETKVTGDEPLLIYEHTKTGEIFLIPDPQLRLEEVEHVQYEVAALLGIPTPGTPTAVATPAPQDPSDPSDPTEN